VSSLFSFWSSATFFSSAPPPFDAEARASLVFASSSRRASASDPVACRALSAVASCFSSSAARAVSDSTLASASVSPFSALPPL